MVALGAEYEETMRLALVKNGPLAIAFNANGMDFYVHGVAGCANASGDCEAGAIDHHAPCDPDFLDHIVTVVGYGAQRLTTAAGDDGASDAAGGAAEDDDDATTYVKYWVIKNRCAVASRRAVARARARPARAQPEDASIHRATRRVALLFERCSSTTTASCDSPSITFITTNDGRLSCSRRARSWGEDWGEDGYYRIVRDVNHCGVADFVVHSVVKGGGGGAVAHGGAQ